MMASLAHALWREAVEWVVSFCLGVLFYAALMRGTPWGAYIAGWMAGVALATALKWCWRWRRRKNGQDRQERQGTP